MAEAISRAERSLAAAQETIKTLEKSAKDSNKIVFKQALEQLVASLGQGNEALSNIEELQRKPQNDSKKPAKAGPLDNVQKKVNDVIQTIGTLEQDPDVKAQMGALQGSLLWAELQTHRSAIRSKHHALKSLRSDRKVGKVETDTQE